MNFVLIHGAWHGGWCWSRVAEPLRAAGHRVYTPTQTGLAERSHLLSRDITLDTFIADIVNLLEWEDLDEVVLVGHSFGGLSAIGAADRVPKRIRHLVFLDALLLDNGQTVFDTMSPEFVASRRRLADETSGGLTLPVPNPASLGVTDVADAAWLRAKCTPHPLSTYESALMLDNPVGNGLPVSYVAVRPAFPALVDSRRYAQERRDWRYMEIEAGHDAMVTAPQLVIRTLNRLTLNS